LGLHHAAAAKLEDYMSDTLPEVMDRVMPTHGRMLKQFAWSQATSAVNILRVTHPPTSEALQGVKHLLAALVQETPDLDPLHHNHRRNAYSDEDDCGDYDFHVHDDYDSDYKGDDYGQV
jgi:hypothetical protein